MKKSRNPIVKRVVDRFETIQQVAKIFVTGDSAQKGLLISGDAGMGKSHYVKQAFIETGTTNRVDYNKSKAFTGAAMYAKLWENRQKGDVVVFDDCSLSSMTGENFRKLTDFFKGALELTSGPRMLGYEAASQNALFKELGVPREFDFQGSIIWITNTTMDKLGKKFGDHWSAIERRFIPISVMLTKEEKYLYTINLIENIEMLGANCDAKDGGYPEDIVEATMDFLADNYENFKDITPGVALKIADTMDQFPTMYKTILDNQNLYI
tara:strand:+ start:109 stop:909 length:801 start_codon:yes stop_codon:yes gene_type:complete